MIFTPPQSHVRVDLEIYDQKEREKLALFRGHERLIQLCQDSLDIPIEQFLTYYLFKRKRAGVPGFRTYSELTTRIGHSYEDLSQHTFFDGASISIPSAAAPPDKGIVERIGEAVALSIVNEVYGLTNADWGPIPESRKKSLDYEIASDGQGIVQVEAKGTTLADNSKKSNGSKVYKHVSDVRKKKSKADTENFSNHITHMSERYGVITGIQLGEPQTLKAWILDPPANNIEKPPASIRLLNRMRYLVDLASFLFPRSQFTSALTTRYADMTIVSDPEIFHSVPLFGRSGQPIQNHPLLSIKSHTSDKSVAGTFFQSASRKPYFLGYRTDLFDIALKQQFDQLLSYRYGPKTDSRSVVCSIPEKSLDRLQLPGWVKERARPYGTYRQFELPGHLMQSSDGMVFGILEYEPIED